MNQETLCKYFVCENMGIAGTTPVHIKKNDDGTVEARCGFSLFGYSNMDEKSFKACGYNPFHDDFMDNYAVGKGETEELALANLKADMKKTADSLWE
jgi:hypothetical protein